MLFSFPWLAGFAIPPEEIKLQRQIFENDPTNIWPDTNLMNYHLFSRGEMDISQTIAQKALYCNPSNEKIYFDLAVIHRGGEAWLTEMKSDELLRLVSLDLRSALDSV